MAYHKVFFANTDVTCNPVFLDKHVSDDFNAGLTLLTRSGQYQKIIRKFVLD